MDNEGEEWRKEDKGRVIYMVIQATFIAVRCSRSHVNRTDLQSCANVTVARNKRFGALAKPILICSLYQYQATYVPLLKQRLDHFISADVVRSGFTLPFIHLLRARSPFRSNSLSPGGHHLLARHAPSRSITAKPAAIQSLDLPIP
jgi:hypothetical protein